MKKILSIMLTLVLMLSALGVTTLAETTDSVNVYVTISDKDGALALANTPVTVIDIDNDNALTINDALYCAHEENYEGGAAEGYNSAPSDWGLSLNKLWGTANGGSYGYYLNNASAFSLTDAVKDNDYLNAFVYTDLTAWSDTYTYFDLHSVTRKPNGKINLTLSAAGYDAEFNSVVLAVEDATITVDGVATEYKTDKNGKVSIQIKADGKHIISAVSDSKTLVPPVCVARIDCNHAKTQTKNVSKATYFANGYSGDTICADCGKTVKVGAKLAKLKLKTPDFSVSANKKQLKVSYKKVDGANGYQVKYVIGKKKVTKTYNSAKAATKKYKNLKKGTYKVYVRAFTTKNNKTAYSAWSQVKNIKVK